MTGYILFLDLLYKNHKTSIVDVKKFQKVFVNFVWLRDLGLINLMNV